MRTIALFSILLLATSVALAQNGPGTWTGNGTGILIDSRGTIATNYHVVKDASEIEVDFGNGDSKRSYKCEVLVTDKKNDLAIIRINDRRFSGFGVLPYGFKTSTARVGESVFALGFPKALSVLGREIKYTRGDISALSGAEGDPTTYTLSLSIQPGNSGGPLFDLNGNLIGITNAKIVSPDVDSVSYAIKSLYLKNLVDLSSFRITLPTGSSLGGKPITEQIEILSDYVGLIKIRLPDTGTESLATPDTSGSSKLVGVWEGEITEAGYPTKIIWQVNADGTYTTWFSSVFGTSSRTGRWRYSDGILDQVTSSATVIWINQNHIVLTIIQNEDGPSSKGRTRHYYRRR